jgi:hypothetical protein
VTRGEAIGLLALARLKRWKRWEQWHDLAVGAMGAVTRWQGGSGGGLAFFRHTLTSQPTAFLKTGRVCEGVARSERSQRGET